MCKGLIFPKNPFGVVDGSGFKERRTDLPRKSASSSFCGIQHGAAVGSPAFLRPVPVVSGYNNLLPVDVTHLNLFFLCCFFLELIFQVEMVKSTLAASLDFFSPRLFFFQLQRCFDWFYPSLHCVSLDYEFMLKTNVVWFVIM